MKIRNKGFSLLELILVLGAIFVLVAGAFSNSSTCGNINVDKILNAILSAPDSVKEGAKLTMGTNVSKENVNAICSTFSCSTQLNSNGYPEIVVDIK